VSHGAFPATCARPASRMHFHEAYNSCSFYSVAEEGIEASGPYTGLQRTEIEYQLYLHRLA
jgi:hypothetical protein